MLTHAVKKGEDYALFILEQMKKHRKHIKFMNLRRVPLHMVAEMEGEKMKEIIQMMVELGADIELKDGLGNFPLEIALQNANCDVSQVLMEIGKNNMKSELKSKKGYKKQLNPGIWMKLINSG